MVTGREIEVQRERLAAISAREAALANTPPALLPYVGKTGGAPFPFNKVGSSAAGGPSVTRPYAESVWVSRAISLIAGEVSSIELEFLDAAEEEITDPALEEFWRAPAIGSDRKRIEIDDVVEMLVTWRKLEGEFFLLLDDSWLVTFATQRSPFVIARPDRMHHIVRSGELVGWEYVAGDGKRYTLLPEQVIHVKRMNPYDSFRGLSEWQAAKIATESDYLAGNFALNLMRNNGDQGVYVVAKGGMPSKEQREQIEETLRLKREARQRGQFRPVFLTGDVAIEDAKMQVPDAAFVSLRLENRHEVFLAFGVPPSMADVKAAYSIGSDSDRHMLVTSTCVPVSKKIAGAFRSLAQIQNKRVAAVCFDWDEHPVMQAVRRERVDTALKLWGTGMPMDQVSDYLGLALPAFPSSSQGFLPFSIAPVEGGGTTPAGDPATSPDTAENDVQGPVGAMLRALMRRRMGLDRPEVRVVEDTKPASLALEDEFRIFSCECPAHRAQGGGVVAQRADRPAKELAQWKTLMAQRRPMIGSFKSAFTRVLMQARVETLKKIETHYVPQKAGGATVTRAGVVDLLFDVAKFTVGFRGAMANQHKAGLQKAGEQCFEELGKDDPFKYPPAAVARFLEKRENKLKDVPQSVYDRVKASLQEGYNAGETSDELAGRVKAEFNDLADGEAKRIGLTETGAVYGAARGEAMKQGGVPAKRWLTSGNANVRAEHAEANGQVVAIDEPFIVGGEELDYPGDDSGSAGNVINCHCVSVAEAEAPAE